MKIYYIHDLGRKEGLSSLLKKNYEKDEVIDIYTDGEVTNIYSAIISRYLSDNPWIVIGEGIGGFYASTLGGCLKILIDAPLYPDVDLKHRIGEEIHTDESSYSIDYEYIRGLAELRSEFYELAFDHESRYETEGIYAFGNGPVNNRSLFKKLYGKEPHIIKERDEELLEALFFKVCSLIEEAKGKINRVQEENEKDIREWNADRSPNRLIFLDVDGVLNCKTTNDSIMGYRGIEDEKVELLRKIVSELDARIILSSSWNATWWKEHKEEQDILAHYLDGKLLKGGLIIFDKTNDGCDYCRGRQIKDFIAKYEKENNIKVTNILILDDLLFDFYEEGLLPYLHQTDEDDDGLTLDKQDFEDIRTKMDTTFNLNKGERR